MNLETEIPPKKEQLKKELRLRLYRRETLAQVSSCEFCEISKNTFYYRTPLVAASDYTKYDFMFQNINNVMG